MKKMIFSILLCLCMVLLLLPMTAKAMEIYVDVNITGVAAFTLEAESGDSITGVKEKIHAETGYPVTQQILMFDNELLEDDHTLADYNIQKESTLVLSLAVPEGLQYSSSDNEVTITGYTGSAAEIAIPHTIGSNPVTAIGTRAFKDCTNLTSITIPNSVTSIGEFTFYGCSSLTSITIPNGVTSIGNGTFQGCTGLTSITIPNGVTSIGVSAFQDCTKLTSITIPDSVTSINGSAFKGCTSLTSIIIPNSVKSIGSYAFRDCTSLKSITIPNSVTSITQETFKDCTSLESITISNGVTSIGVSVFQGCTSLTSITIPDSVTSIGVYAFMDCTSLTSITIPDSVTSIGNFTFYGCSSLESITIPNSVTSIGFSAFKDCTKLTSITIPDSVTSIKGSAFKGCTSLTSITIPKSVKSIFANACYGCSMLKDVYYLGTIEEWDTITIDSPNNDLTDKVRCIGDITQGFSFTQPGNLTYDGKAKEATVTKTNEDYGDFTIKYYDQNDQVYTTGPVDAGTYTVKIDIEESRKYSAVSDYEVGRFTILQAENSFTTDLSIEDWTYGDPPKAPTAAAKFGTPTYSYSTEEDGTYTTDQPTNAGTYWVKATVDETKNYTGLEAKKQFRILQKYTVTYAAGSNGSGNVTAGSKTQDVAFTLSSDTFTRAGYEQTGWSTSDGGEKVYELGGSYTANEDITLYSVWSDITKPTGEISIGTKSWKTFLNNITFGLFFKDTQTVTITASDNSGEDVTIEYLLSDKELDETELASATFTAYTEVFSINPGNKYVIYAKLTDTSGNVAYINSEGIVLDSIAPVISGVENGKTYCEAQTVTVTEEYIESVKVNSTEVTLDANNQFTLNPAEGKQTIVVTDKAKNETTITITFTLNAKAVVDNDTKSPRTGDNSHMAFWIALLLVSGAGVIGTTVYGRKKRAK